MNDLVDQLGIVADNPWSWLVVAVMAAFAAHSIVIVMICPFAHGTAEISDEALEKARAAPFTPGARYVLTMLAGIALALAGLAMIASGFSPFVALSALVAGLILTQTEPVRLMIREHRLRVVANRDAPDEVKTGTRDRLLAGHRTLAATNVAILIALTAGLLAF